MKTNHYQPRFVSDKLNTTYNSFFSKEEENNKTLLDAFRDTPKIVLLGNPGIGKTTELKNIFEKLWDSKSETGNIPFYINIKNFRERSKFEELIPFKQWAELPIITFILDGLDEIAKIQDFVSELELFLSKNKEKTINVILSCRTNIYEKYLINITEFKYFYLENLNEKQITKILKENYALELSNFDLEKYKVYLENPFNLDLFANFFIENNRFPETQQECWDLFIKTELKKLNKEKLNKRENLDISHITKCIEKVAFINELMEQNYIIDDDLLSLIGKDDKNTFEQITFIERLPQSENLIFRHKNYQEFFAAKFLSGLDSDKIIETIKIHKDINLTKPTLFNTITFLLNILKSDKYQEIKEWLLKNEYEILFHSEPDRLDEKTKNKIFEKYFKETCIEKTFWIGKNRRFSVNTIARFANLDFLISHIKDEKNPFRSVKSAIDILSFVPIPNNRKTEFKSQLLGFLYNTEYKEDILRVIISHKFHKEEAVFIKITDFFKNEYSPEINHQIILMLNDINDLDNNFKILKNSLYKLYEIKQERISDKTIRGTEWILEELIFKINSSKNFIQILNIIFNDQFALKLSDFYKKDFKQKLFQKISNFIKEDISFLYKIIDAFIKPENNYIYRKDQFLPELIKFSKTEYFASKYILENHNLDIKTLPLISFISSKATIDNILELFKTNFLKVNDTEEINRLKWNLYNNNTELGYYFEKEMIESGFKFTYKLPTQADIEREKKEYKKFIQENFDVLFDASNLLNKIRNVFVQNEKEKISWAEYHEINMQWYKETNYHSISYTIHEIISKAIRDYNSQTFESISYLLKDDYFILSIIKDKIKRDTYEKFIIKNEQIDFIKNKCFKILENFNYSQVIEFSDEDNRSFSVYPNYYILKTLYFFDQKFDFIYPNIFYLNTLEYYNIIENSEENDILTFISQRINKDELNNQIIKNIKEKRLSYFPLKNHIYYSLENKLVQTYEKIGNIIIEDKNSFTDSNLIIKYCDLIENQKDFLKSCCNNIDSYLCWNAIDILKTRNLDDKFILEIARKYIKTEKENFLQKAINILFYTNQKNALEIYIKSLIKINQNPSKHRADGYIIEDLLKYNQIEELHRIKDFFDIVYNDKSEDTFDFHYSKQMLNSLVNLFSRNEKNYKYIQSILNEIKNIYKENYSKTFFINHLIESSKETYLNSLREKLNFKQSKKIIETINL
ncbi:NACHT domain-containing protein [Flavobacterium faecale]|uniref:NACHT domain-containing protein n=1 Tax=Flavobacterium faecale TaxID=1355330 RepID=UPI003AAD8403